MTFECTFGAGSLPDRTGEPGRFLHFTERACQNVRLGSGIEARGFIFGSAIALALGAKFIPLRKPRKLPGEVLSRSSVLDEAFSQIVSEKISEKYVLEYGTDCLEMHVGAIEPGERVLIVDDLVATGGTLSAAIRLLV
ncbi:hypothetical protein PR202_ga01977 [Eleusine coracana subsp. coracana]|uniref:adenine phosphoribosyltransferase n=1 Tax=Eleusine coracana subsp. coracana TaxID=191504 RepID=A0AAV5BKG6_ELECO|nr:hypothetical protein PR202_ga01290 [Eleusine coracana subsp. coracana]GJM86148.1 hypothetical protein PR202_ga01977 [Eleusine coracana subsp. coracana]